MQFKLIIDECVDCRIIQRLREQKFEIISIFEEYRSLSDDKILDLATTMNALLITEDSDFGEWIFSHHRRSVGVIYLRYHPREINDIVTSLKYILTHYDEKLYGKFTVITVNKIRMRDI